MTPPPPPSQHLRLPRPKALLFDFMGTCLNWYSSITSGFASLNPSCPIAGEQGSELAMAWRLAYFAARRERSDKGLAVEDIDVTHRRTLDRLLEERGYGYGEWGEEARVGMVARWHCQEGKMREWFVCLLACMLCREAGRLIWCSLAGRCSCAGEIERSLRSVSVLVSAWCPCKRAQTRKRCPCERHDQAPNRPGQKLRAEF